MAHSAPHSSVHPPEMPELLLVAHGTGSEAGMRTADELRAAVAAARPHVTVRLCFLDVARPTLADALADTDTDAHRRATVVVPLLLSTGYHVLFDIPSVVADRADVVVARHLGPHALLTDALIDRLADLPSPDVSGAGAGAAGAATVLVAAGSRLPQASAELTEAAALLATRIGAPVRGLTVGDSLAERLTEMAQRCGGQTIRIATYLLTEGHFADVIVSAARGIGQVTAPLGAHPALVSLVWLRYADAVSSSRR